jgi:peptidoglycan/xylan/chitin deacetylase (PgdA/CDA1 family)
MNQLAVRAGSADRRLRADGTMSYKQLITRAALDTLYYTQGARLIEPWSRGVGVILTLHQVSPGPARPFDPNGILRVTPQFLEQSIELVRRQGLDTVSLDEAHRRMVHGDFERPFVAFTLDDGYRDNLEEAYPIFKKHGVPFCVYVPSRYADGAADLWWLALEHVLEEVAQITVKIDGVARKFDLSGPAEKAAAWNTIYWWLRRIDEDEARAVVAELSRSMGWDAKELAQTLIMTWDEVRKLAADPLVTIGAHTVNHFALAKLPRARARYEMAEGADRLARELGTRPKHFSFPYGSAEAASMREFELARELGFLTGVTTRKGLVHAEHMDHLHALPRLSLNGNFANARHLSVLLTGVPFALMRRFRKLDVA